MTGGRLQRRSPHVRRMPGTMFLRDDGGVSAIEFALLAPVLFFAVAAMLDVGLAVYERMTLDRLLRGGAQVAMADPGRDHVEAVIRASAEEDFAPDTDFTLPPVRRYCACPADIETEIACTSLCSGNIAPGIFYRMEATRSYSGIILPEINLSAEATVQVR